MRFHNQPEAKNTPFTLAKFSGWASGLAWFLLFSVIFSDQIFSMGEEGSEVALYLCIGPVFILAVLGFILGLITGLVARKTSQNQTEVDHNYAANGIKYALFGFAYLVLSPFINLIIRPIGIELYNIASLFGH